MKSPENKTTRCPIAKLIQSKVGRPKSEQKRKDILAAAGQLFLNQGFSSTSMDMVAANAGVSKQTVYSHFNNKDSLFTAVIHYKCAEYQIDADHMGGVDDYPRDTMIRVGVQIMGLLLDQEAIAMHRVVIGEMASNPRVAELFYTAGPQNGIQLLSNYMHKNQHLKLDEKQARYWSIAFMNLLKGDFHLRSLLGLPFEISKENQLNEVIKVTELILHMIEHQKPQAPCQ